MAEEKFKDLPTGLYWKGKKTEVDRVVLPFQTIETINESRATREREKKVSIGLFKDKSNGDWYNRLIWGDNKYIMASLLEKFAGKIDLIYIDPPFFTGTDQEIILKVGEENQPLEKQPSLIEEAAYRNIWHDGNDSYFQWIYDKFVLIRSLLSNKGALFIRHDQYWSHYVKIIADEVFGKSKFANEIVVNRIHKNVTKQGKISIPIATDSLFLYMVGVDSKFYDIKKKLEKSRDGYWRSIDDSSGVRHPPERVIFGETFYPPAGKHFKFSQEKIDKMIKDGKIRLNPKTVRPQYWVEPSDEVIIDSDWTDISGYSFTTGYPTENSEKLLKRVIKACSNEGDLVADFFCGSGTTGAVAEKLDRRWIMADLGRYAIHTTRKRLLGIDNCKPFVVQNLGKYERQYWQGVTFKKRSDEQMPIYEYIVFILKLYNAEPLTGMLHIHGKKGRHFVHVGAVDAPVTLSEIKEAMDEVKQAGQKALDILGWEWEMGLHDVVEKTAKESGIHLRLLSIPRDVMDPRAAAKGDVTFYELAYLEVDIKPTKDGRFVVELKDFAIPNLDLIPQEVRDKIKKWSDYIDYWSVDWDWNEDTFHNMWQSYRTRKERKLELTSDAHKYESSGNHKLMVKVIDIFGNDTTHVIEVKS